MKVRALISGKGQPTEAPAPLSEPGFRWFFAGRSISLLGSSMAPVALAFAVLGSSHSAGDLGIILAARSIPMIVFLLVGGVVADRFSRRTVLMASNLGAALTQGAVACLLISGSFHLATIAALELLNGAITAFTSPALRGIVPQLVGSDQRQRANSLLGSSKNAISILGPSLAGGIVMSLGGGWAIAMDAATYLAAAFFMARLTLPDRVKSSPTSFLSELREGWTGFRSLTWVCVIVGAFAVTNCIYVGVWNVLGPAFANVSLGAAAWGAVLSARAIGVLVASAAMYRLTALRSLTTGLVLFALGAFPMIVLGLNGSVYLLAPVAFAAGLGQGVMGITWETSLQDHVPNTLLSRVAAYDDLVSYIAVPVGQISVAPLASAFGDTQVMVIGGILFGLVSVAPVLSRSVRRPGPPAPEPARAAASS
ncbi:MFS transporter [Streptomyces sp. NPDC091267]|uniref:MFS transporter n=1 Tax=Streptomyces sp. NPDC091267 TaxID=3155195 RepID=UPI003428F3EA